MEPTVTEFFAPFVHIPGRFEWCTIHSPTHGSFDVMIVLGEDTSVPCDVYVCDDAGAAFMRDRYPECRAHRVGPENLRIEAQEGSIGCALDAMTGPLLSARMRFAFDATQVPREVPYGGNGRPVWGGRFACTGVDLERDADVTGHVVLRDGSQEDLEAPGIATAGSFGRIEPL